MKKTAVEWLFNDYVNKGIITIEAIEQAKEMEKNNADNKIVHFGEWLTDKHTTTIINLYEHFEQQYYQEKNNPE